MPLLSSVFILKHAKLVAMQYSLPNFIFCSSSALHKANQYFHHKEVRKNHVSVGVPNHLTPEAFDLK